MKNNRVGKYVFKSKGTLTMQNINKTITQRKGGPGN